MKKLLALLLSLTLVFTLVACAEEAAPAPEPTPTPAPTPTPTPAPEEEEATTLTGFVNYKFADADLRHTFMAAAERFLVDQMAAGIPLWNNAGYALYSSRLQLPVDEYLPVMGFGTSFGTMSADDSTVEIEDGVTGNAGEYTYRTTIAQNPETFNQWLYQGSITSDLMGYYFGSLYYFNFNEAKDGYSVLPNYASAMPEPVNSTILETGKEVSRTWRIPLAEAEWFFHPDTDTSAFPAGYEDITAQDYVDTYRIALENKWFRAVSGGGDFVTSPQRVVNAGEFSNGLVDWEEVGIKAVDDYTLEFQFVVEQSEWNVIYWLSSFVLMPISTELYDVLGAQYGIDEVSTGYHGAYYVDFYEPDRVLRMKENPNFIDPDRYFFTGYNFAVIAEADIRFEEFVAGRLEGVSLPSSRFEEYRNDPRIRQIPGATVFRLNYNATGSRDNMGLQWEVADKGPLPADFVPEPLLASLAFRRAMYFAVDREFLAYEVIKTVQPEQFLFTAAYLVEPEAGIAYRSTPQGPGVVEGYSPATFGYNKDAAIALFDEALAPLVANGTYSQGDVISMDLAIDTTSETGRLAFEYIKAAFEETFVSERYGISVEITQTGGPFPQNYFNYIIPGISDLGFGGISGSTLDAAGFLDVYTYDNRSGFTLNWGIDTRQAVIPVRYEFAGEERYELWSFDAIAEALSGEVYLVDGAVAAFPAPANLEAGIQTASFDISNYFEPQFVNITYTVSELVDGVPVALPEYDGVSPDSRFVALFGLKPGASYQVEISFGFADEPSRVETTSAEFTTRTE